LEVGDNLAINVEDGNLEGVSFYLIFAPKHFIRYKNLSLIIRDFF
jgi:hypothetical protein